MSGSIVFSQIPATIRQPLFYAEFNNTAAGTAQPVQRTLIIGQSTVAQPATPAYVPSVAAAQSSYGAGSQLTLMIAAYLLNDPAAQLWVLPLADAAGSTAATGTIAISGTATANGTLALRIAGTLVPVGVASAQVASAIATAVATAINAVTSLPVTASASSGNVTLTAANKGTLGNDIPVVLNYLGAQGGESTPAGLTVSVTGMANGATDPTMTSATLATALGQTGFDFIINPYKTNLAATSGLLADASGRWNYQQQLYGHAFSGDRDTVANLLTAGAAPNDQHLTIWGVNAAAASPGWLYAAARTGAFAASSKARANRPSQYLAVAGVLPEPVGQEITWANREALLEGGIGLGQRSPGGGDQLVRAVTTYLTNPAGVPDDSYEDAETMFTLMYVSRFFKSSVTQKFPRALVADDGTPLAPTPPGDTPVVVTPSVIRNELIVQYGLLVADNYCQDPAAFANGLIVQRNANDPGRIDVLAPVILVVGLRVVAMQIQFAFTAATAQAA